LFFVLTLPYTITKTLKKDMKTFKKGDRVRLISLSKVAIETQNWIDNEKSCPSIGDIFTVQFDCQSDHEFLTLEELLLSHPQSKFELITKEAIAKTP
jgi:hypothetical protein